MTPADVVMEGANRIAELYRVREHASSLLEALATGHFSLSGSLEIECDQHGRVGRKARHLKASRNEAMAVLRMQIETARKSEAEIIRRLNQLEIEVPANPFATIDLQSANMIAGKRKP